MNFLGGHERKALVQIKPHLVAEDAARTHASAVGLEHTMRIHMAQKIFVLGADRAGCHGQTRIIRPGFIRFCGSSARLMARIICSATADLYFSSCSTFRLPIPCSAEIEPSNAWTESNTMVLTWASCCFRKAAASTPSGACTL